MPDDHQHHRLDTLGPPEATGGVTNWQSGEVALRWSAAAFVETEKNYRRLTGHDHLWILKAHLDREDAVAEMQKVGPLEVTVAANLLLPVGDSPPGRFATARPAVNTRARTAVPRTLTAGTMSASE